MLRNIKDFILHFSRTIAYVTLIRGYSPKLGFKRVIYNFLKTGMNYVLIELLLHKKIHKQNIFGKTIYVLDYLSFIYSFEEIFIFDEYYFVTNDVAPCILDLGSNIGMSVLYFKLLYPEAKIIAVEPDTTSFKTLKKFVGTNRLQNVELINRAVSDKKGAVNFYFDSQVRGSLKMSTIKERMPKESILVKSILLSELLNKFDKINLIKMDIEGAEEKVLLSMRGKSSIKRIEQIIVEYHHHIKTEENKLSRLLRFLEDSGFNYQLDIGKRFVPFKKNIFQNILIFSYPK